MGIKLNQLKKFKVKDLKKIIKDNKLGKITKLKKTQLIGLISNCDICKDILSKLSLPKKIIRKASAKQLEARRRFAEMAKSRKKPALKLINKGISELKDIAFDKSLKFPDTVTKEQLISLIETGKKTLKNINQNELDNREKLPVVLEAKKEIQKIVKKIETAEKKKTKKEFLDTIFGIDIFNFKKEMSNILNEMDDEDQIERFLSLKVNQKKELLTKRFETNMSITRLINKIIK